MLLVAGAHILHYKDETGLHFLIANFVVRKVRRTTQPLAHSIYPPSRSILRMKLFEFPERMKDEQELMVAAKKYKKLEKRRGEKRKVGN